MFKPIARCRLCGNLELADVLNLGRQPFTHVFPKTRTQQVPAGPLKLVRCTGEPDVCGLVQLQHTYDELSVAGPAHPEAPSECPTERRCSIVTRMLSRMQLPDHALIIDTGDGDDASHQLRVTSACSVARFNATPVDLKNFHATNVQCIPHTFSAVNVKRYVRGRKASIIASYSALSQREDPLAFMADILQVLDDDGICLLELPYMSAMLQMNSYDSVRHEHVGYYALRQLSWMADKVGLKIVDVEIEGSRFSVIVAKRSSSYLEQPQVAALLDEEARAGLHTSEPYHSFAHHCVTGGRILRCFFDGAKRAGKKVTALGATSNGNVLLHYCNITQADIACIGEVDPHKLGTFTPGTLLPVVSEDEMLAMKPDYLIVLPWHRRNHFLRRQTLVGRSLIFPLPQLELVRIPPHRAPGSLSTPGCSADDAEITCHSIYRPSTTA